jgi:hypothetical protein
MNPKFIFYGMENRDKPIPPRRNKKGDWKREIHKL